MSHVAKVKMSKVINNLDYLAEACKKIGLELVKNCTQYRYYAGKMQKCNQKITIPGNNTCYEIGVLENNDGSFTFEWDTFGGGNGIVNKAGNNCSKIFSVYEDVKTYNEVKQLADEQGGFMTEYINSNGEQEYKIEIY